MGSLKQLAVIVYAQECLGSNKITWKLTEGHNQFKYKLKEISCFENKNLSWEKYLKKM